MLVIQSIGERHNSLSRGAPSTTRPRLRRRVKPNTTRVSSPQRKTMQFLSTPKHAGTSYEPAGESGENKGSVEMDAKLSGAKVWLATHDDLFGPWPSKALLYLASAHPYVKVGISTNVGSRISSLATHEIVLQSKFKRFTHVQVYASTIEAVDLEQAIFSALSERIVQGEWLHCRRFDVQETIEQLIGAPIMDSPPDYTSWDKALSPSSTGREAR